MLFSNKLCCNLRTRNQSGFLSLTAANQKPLLEMENEEKIRLEARRRLEEQLKQYRVQRQKERVSEYCHCCGSSFNGISICH